MPAQRGRRSRWSIPLGRIAGIEISLHLTFFLLVGLVVAADVAPGGAGVGDGLLWLAVIVAAVLAHELAHSVVARALGGRVRAILLLPIGGVSQIERMPQGWRAELAVAAAGPLTSLAAGSVLAAAAWWAGVSLLPVDLYGGAFLARSAWLNVVLGGFNLLPAFPLDGGRVLRALLSRRRDPTAATALAAAVGRAFGGAMVVVGLFWDLWLCLIGVVVYLGASSEERAQVARARLEGVPAWQLMRRRVPWVDARQPLATLGGGTRPLVVVDGGRFYGMLDQRGLPGQAAGTVADVTDRAVLPLRPDEDLGRSGLDRLVGSGYPLLPVVDDDGTILGILAVEDIDAWLAVIDRRPRASGIS